MKPGKQRYTNNLEIVTELLIHPAIDISIEDWQLRTPLQFAVGKHAAKTARLLLERSIEEERSVALMETPLQHE